MLSLVISFATSFILTGFVIHYQHHHNHMSGDYDFDSPQKFHAVITPRIGGAAIWLGLAIATLYKWAVNPDLGSLLFLVLAASLPVFLAGITEDLTKRIGVKLRLLTGFLSGLIFLLFFDITAMRFGFGELDLWLNHPWFVVLFLTFGLTGITNAYNIIDGFNGLSSMVAIISALAITYVAFKVGDTLALNLALILIGAIAGFFLWNYPRGHIFLGDGGAYLLGFSIGCLSILLISRNPIVSPWFAILINIYPIFETLFTIWRRKIINKSSITNPDGMHLHTLIYRKISRSVKKGDTGRYSNQINSNTSPYLWAISLLGVIPAILLWDDNLNLLISCIIFSIIYCYLYKKLLEKYQNQIL